LNILHRINFCGILTVFCTEIRFFSKPQNLLATICGTDKKNNIEYKWQILIFKKLIISDWKQFEQIDIDFHPQLTVMTGANGSGKTTIITMLSRHFV
jgi:predicted ATPase